jgi:hypothetical protein
MIKTFTLFRCQAVVKTCKTLFWIKNGSFRRMNFVKHEYLCIKDLREFKGNVKATDDIKSVFIAGQMENLISPVVKFIGNESSQLSFKVRVKIFDANFMND